MIQKKYKLSDVAKDLNVSVNELTELLLKCDTTPKKPTVALTDGELDFVFNHYTQKNQVKNFNEYFAVMDQRPAVKAPVEAPAAPAPKAEAPKPAAQAAQPVSKPAAPVQKAEAPKPAAPAAQPVTRPAAPAPKTEAPKPPVPAQKPMAPAQRAEAPASRPSAPAAQSVPQPAARPQQQNTRREFPANNQANRDQYAQNNARPPKPVMRPNTNQPRPGNGLRPNTNQPFNSGKPSVQGGVNVNAAPQQPAAPKETVVRHVDTRTVDVNLDKYNEHYDQLAPQQSRRNEGLQKKQKINQKSKQIQKQKYSTKRETEFQKLQRLALERARKQQLKVLIPDEIVVSELAVRLKVNVAEVIKKLMGLGEMKAQNDVLDFDTASLVAEELGAKVEKEVLVTIEERLIDDSEDDSENLMKRSPVVVVMGHVDHGKTSLLDKIRHSDVTATEAGGITQHIGAYTVSTGGKTITFLDTPGHEAFTAMRARGAAVTDIVILVVAADDGIMPQTVEAINHAKAANVQIIVAINKIDKPHANPDKVMQEMTEYGLVPEAWGGDVICCPVSAITGEGVDQLLEMINLVADVADLKANPNRRAKGTVIEARLDKGRGPVATLLVQNGTLHSGDVVIAGSSVGRIRVMNNDKGIPVQEAGPSTPVEITGLAEVPSAGDTFDAVEDERLARELVDQRKYDQKEEIFRQYQKVTLDNLFNSIEQGEMKELPLIVKADVQGTAEAVKQSLEKLTNEEVRVRVIHCGVGAVNKSDLMLAQASGAIIIGFNVRPDQTVRDDAEKDDVEIRLYRIIYDAIDDVKQAMKGMLAPKTREVELGRAEVRQVYKITNVGTIAGCYVIEGKVARNALIRVVRDGIVLAEDKIDSLKRFKDDAKEVAQGFECGIGLDKFNAIKEGDILESFIIEEYRD